MKKLTTLFSFLFLILIKSQTNISGGIFTNTTLTLSNSPYIVTNNLVVFPNIILTIEPGVELRFEKSKYLEVRGDLVAIGTSANRIVFTSNAASPTNSDWAGIKISSNAGGKASFEYCDFKYAITSNINECCILFGPINYKNCRFLNNYTGISGSGYKMKIENCEFINNYYGITDGNRTVINSTFTNNKYGIFVTSGGIDVDNSVFINNETAIKGGGGFIKNSIIKNNIIGVENVWSGFDISLSEISNNQIGIITSENRYMAPIKNNKICNNTLYNVQNIDYYNRDLTQNCWCETNQSIIESKLKDGYDDVNLGVFNYSIYDSVCQNIISVVIKDSSLSTKDFNAILHKAIVGPNPTKDYVNIKLNKMVKGLDVGIYNLNGELLLNFSEKNLSEIKISLNDLKTGAYLLKLKTGDEVITKKIIKE